jgi:hypothetical protein
MTKPAPVFRSPSAIAKDIRREIIKQCGEGNYSAFGVGPLMHYIGALQNVQNWQGSFGADSVLMIACYVESNFASWRGGGEKAKTLKAEFRKTLKWAQKQEK